MGAVVRRVRYGSARGGHPLPRQVAAAEAVRRLRRGENDADADCAEEPCAEERHDACHPCHRGPPAAAVVSTALRRARGVSSSTRSIGYSPSAGRVLTVIAYRDDGGDLHLINAWPATAAVLKIYREERDHGEHP